MKKLQNGDSSHSDEFIAQAIDEKQSIGDASVKISEAVRQLEFLTYVGSDSMGFN
jgi:hypothetical protein